MIADTFTIRKVDGNLIVGAHEPNAPIQVVQQLSDTMLNVHLKNGFNYKHECVKKDIISTLLEMFGYQRFLITITARAWLCDCHVHVKSLSGKFLSAQINEFITDNYEYEPNIKCRVTKAKCVYIYKQPHPSYVSDYTWEFEIIANASHMIEIEELFLCRDSGKHFLSKVLNFASLSEKQLKEARCGMNSVGKQLRGEVQSVYYSLKE